MQKSSLSSSLVLLLYKSYSFVQPLGLKSITRGREVLSTLEGVYSRAWYLGEKKGSRKYKRDVRRIWRKNGCGNKKQEKIDRAEEQDFRRGELLGKFTARMLYG